MPIFTLPDNALIPWLYQGSGSQCQAYFTPEYSVRSRSSTLPHPNPKFRGFFLPVRNGYAGNAAHLKRADFNSFILPGNPASDQVPRALHPGLYPWLLKTAVH